MAGNTTFDIRTMTGRPNFTVSTGSNRNTTNSTQSPQTTTNSNTTNNQKGGTQNNSTPKRKRTQKGKNNPATTPAPNKGKVQTAEGPEEFDVLPDAPNLEAINAEYVPHIYNFNVNPETVHSVYGTADLKKIRMSLDEE